MKKRDMKGNIAMNNTDVVLALMPFASLTYPSLALGCLAGALREAGISSRSLYFTFALADKIGLGDYFRLGFSPPQADWLFSRAAFPDMERDDAAFFRDHPGPCSDQRLLDIRDHADAIVAEAARQVIALKPRIVGVSSTFFQNCAALALLRAIREAAPDIVTVIGGANCEGRMGTEMHRSFPWVDYVFSGEADETFPTFCRALLAGEKIGGVDGRQIPGVLAPADRGDAGESTADEGFSAPLSDSADQTTKPARATVADLSTLPLPDLDGYFAALEQCVIRERIIPFLMLETARGCPWGGSKPCLFCGLNALAGKQRMKKTDQAYHEIHALTKRHGVQVIQMADNMIASAHIKDLLPRFKDSGLRFMYEVPATLSREQLKQLAAAGVRRMQPGIEQLHDKSLAAMGKPNRLFQNIRFLKWAREFGIGLAWNCLYGFPGEDDAWHGETADLIPLLTHLQPPTAAVPIRFCNFSSYHSEQERFGLSLTPMSYYRHVYPLDRAALMNLAYFFEDEGMGPIKEKTGCDRLKQAITEWKTLFPPLFAVDRPVEPILTVTVGGGNEAAGDGPVGVSATSSTEIVAAIAGGIHITDSRPVAVAPQFTYHGIAAGAYLAADAGKTLADIARMVAETEAAGADPDFENKIEGILQGFVADGLMLKLDDDRYISLAVRAPFQNYDGQDLSPDERTRLWGGFRRSVR